MSKWTGPMGRSQNVDATNHPRFSDYLARARKVAGDLERQVRFGEVWSGVRTVRIAADAVVRAMVIDNFKQGQPQVKVDLIVTTQPIDDEDVPAEADLTLAFAMDLEDLGQVLVVPDEAGSIEAVLVNVVGGPVLSSPPMRPATSEFSRDDEDQVRFGAFTWEGTAQVAEAEGLQRVVLSWGEYEPDDPDGKNVDRYKTTPKGRSVFFRGQVIATVPETHHSILGVAARGSILVVVVQHDDRASGATISVLQTNLNDPEEWETVSDDLVLPAFGASVGGVYFSSNGQRAIHLVSASHGWAEVELFWDADEGWYDSNVSLFQAQLLTLTASGSSSSNSTSESNPPDLDWSCSITHIRDEDGNIIGYEVDPPNISGSASGSSEGTAQVSSSYSLTTSGFNLVWPAEYTPVPYMVLGLDYAFGVSTPTSLRLQWAGTGGSLSASGGGSYSSSSSSHRVLDPPECVDMETSPPGAARVGYRETTTQGGGSGSASASAGVSRPTAKIYMGNEEVGEVSLPMGANFRALDVPGTAPTQISGINAAFQSGSGSGNASQSTNTTNRSTYTWPPGGTNPTGTAHGFSTGGGATNKTLRYSEDAAFIIAADIRSRWALLFEYEATGRQTSSYTQSAEQEWTVFGWTEAPWSSSSSESISSHGTVVEFYRGAKRTLISSSVATFSESDSNEGMNSSFTVAEALDGAALQTPHLPDGQYKAPLPIGKVAGSPFGSDAQVESASVLNHRAYYAKFDDIPSVGGGWELVLSTGALEGLANTWRSFFAGPSYDTIFGSPALGDIDIEEFSSI